LSKKLVTNININVGVFYLGKPKEKIVLFRMFFRNFSKNMGSEDFKIHKNFAHDRQRKRGTLFNKGIK